jgi:hypothetical protein
MFGRDAFENVSVRLKACQIVSAQYIDNERISYQVPLPFEPQNLVHPAFREQERWAFSTHCNARIPLSLCGIGGWFDEAACTIEQSSRVMRFIEHYCGQRLGNIQGDQSPPRDGITDIDALGTQSLKNSCAVWLRRHQNGCFISPEHGGDKVCEALSKHVSSEHSCTS